MLQVEITGVSDTAAEMFERSLELGLGNAGLTVASRSVLRGRLARTGYTEGCLFGPCLQAIYRDTGLRLVMVARITGVGQSYSFVLTLLDTRTGVPTSQAVDRCDVCTLDEVEASVSMAVIGLVAGVGSSTVVDPGTGPTGSRGVTDVAQLRAHVGYLEQRRTTARRYARHMTVAAAALAGVGSYFLVAGDDEVGYSLMAAGAAFGVAGGTLFHVSGKF